MIEMKMTKFGWIIFLGAILLLNICSSSFAQERRVPREKRRVEVKTHNNCNEIIVKERHYFFRSGIFYEKGSKGYIGVTAPVGARINVLPLGYKIIRRKRATFYFFGGAYYRFIPREKIYVVVEKPL